MTLLDEVEKQNGDLYLETLYSGSTIKKSRYNDVDGM